MHSPFLKTYNLFFCTERTKVKTSQLTYTIKGSGCRTNQAVLGKTYASSAEKALLNVREILLGIP